MFTFIKNIFRSKKESSESSRKLTVLDEVLTPEEQDTLRAGTKFLNAGYRNDEIKIGQYNCSFHSDLTNFLKSQHNALVKIVTGSLNFAKQGEYVKVNKLMHEFRASWTLHVKTENIQVYTYISEMADTVAELTTDQDTSRQMKKYSTIAVNMAQEMRGIERFLRSFFKDFSSPTSKQFEIGPDNVEEFLYRMNGNPRPLMEGGVPVKDPKTGEPQLETIVVPALGLRIEKEHSQLYRIYDELSPERVRSVVESHGDSENVHNLMATG
jgi:hypothetical protein